MNAETLIDHVKSLPPIMIGAAIIVFLLVLAGIRLLFRKQPAHLTAFAGEAGSVLVSRKAIQELIKQTCLMDQRVEASRPTIRFANSKVHTHVELRLTSSENLKESSEHVQNRITELLKKSLNFDQIGEIKITVTSFGSEISEVVPESTQIAIAASDPQVPTKHIETQQPSLQEDKEIEEIDPIDEKSTDEDSQPKGN